jgi:hypothetical protein
MIDPAPPALIDKLSTEDLSEMDVSPDERAALAQLVTLGIVRTYRHRPNDGSSVLTYWTLDHPPAWAQT